MIDQKTTKVRLEVLRHYGGDPVRCAWCGRTEGPWEIDHVIGGQGEGNTHRKAIGVKLEVWLRRQHFPTGYQVLDTHCHDLKSGRIRRMPAKKGSQDVHISLPDDLVERLTVLASAPGMTRSKVLEAALVQHLEQGASETLLTGLLTRFDTMTAVVTQALLALQKSVQAQEVKVTGLSSRVDAQATRFKEFVEAVHSLYDQEKAARNGQGKGGLFSSLMGRQ